MSHFRFPATELGQLFILPTSFGDSGTIFHQHNIQMAEEPVAPSVLTQVPGPRTLNIKEELDPFFDSRAIQLVIDYKKSNGN
jgi:hypothetical protein